MEKSSLPFSSSDPRPAVPTVGLPRAAAPRSHEDKSEGEADLKLDWDTFRQDVQENSKKQSSVFGTLVKYGGIHTVTIAEYLGISEEDVKKRMGALASAGLIKKHAGRYVPADLGNPVV